MLWINRGYIAFTDNVMKLQESKFTLIENCWKGHWNIKIFKENKFYDFDEKNNEMIDNPDAIMLYHCVFHDICPIISLNWRRCDNINFHTGTGSFGLFDFGEKYVNFHSNLSKILTVSGLLKKNVKYNKKYNELIKCTIHVADESNKIGGIIFDFAENLRIAAIDKSNINDAIDDLVETCESIANEADNVLANNSEK